MKNKRHIHFCAIGESLVGKKRAKSRKKNDSKKKSGSNELSDIYNKYYKSQIAALYRAMQGYWSVNIDIFSLNCPNTIFTS